MTIELISVLFLECDLMDNKLIYYNDILVDDGVLMHAQRNNTKNLSDDVFP